jgi:leucyl/phenylalanyl-tRNA--protein transferase
LLNAYANGIFPWFSEGEPILWWSLDPRLIIRPGEMKVSKSLRHTLNSGKFEVRIDTNFREVMRHCAETPREGQDGTWILDEMVEAYCRLHELGFAHSFETYLDGQLVGGLYWVSIGKAFFGESMFHTVSDASKVASTICIISLKATTSSSSTANRRRHTSKAWEHTPFLDMTFWKNWKPWWWNPASPETGNLQISKICLNLHV